MNLPVADTNPKKEEHQQHPSDDPTHLPKMARFLICATGICACYLSYGILQEQLATEHTLDTSFVLLSQCAMNVLLALIWKQVQQQQRSTKAIPLASSTSPLPHTLLVGSAMCYTIATVCSNEAIRYVSYPVQVLVKSIKLLPIMVIGQLLELGNRKQRSRMCYSTCEWIAAFMICMGIVGFQYYQHNHKNSTSHHHHAHNQKPDDSFWYGMSLLLISLILDGVLGSCQSWIKQSTHHRRPTAGESMLYINGYAFLGLFTWTITTGSILSGLHTIRTVPHVGMALLILNAAAAAGQVFIFLTVAWFSPVTTTLITTTRKFGTIVLSVLYYGHAFAPTQWGCMALIFVGLYMAILQTVFQPNKAIPRTTIEEPPVIHNTDKAKME
jgi:UDP-galactose transporter B1